MVIGIGTDLVQIPRIERIMHKFAERFLAKIFTYNEIMLANKIDNFETKCRHIAKRFAAKEAFAKAIGTGIGSSVGFHDIEIGKNIRGKPQISLNYARPALRDLSKATVHVTLTDDYPIAIAFIVIERG